MKKIFFAPATRAATPPCAFLPRRTRFARTGEGDIKKLEGNTNDLRQRVGDRRVR